VLSLELLRAAVGSGLLRGLRVIGGGLRLELPWPELSSYPGYGLVRTRASLDEQLARRAEAGGVGTSAPRPDATPPTACAIPSAIPARACISGA